jgi:hypothetical protein
LRSLNKKWDAPSTKWISRVPLSIKKAKNLVRSVKKYSLKDSESKG